MIYWDIFWAFFISNLLGYGGGPSTIPLIQNEVVSNYEWMSLSEFGDVLAIANALPGPIATKMAGFIGFELGGVLGAAVALIATILPSALAVIVLFKFVDLFKDSPRVKLMTKSVQPIIAVLLAVMAYQFFITAFQNSGVLHLLLLTLASYLTLYKFKVHPALVIGCALFYGGVFLS
ncbi:chromate transporter [Bacillus thermotolerans]|uniref:Chromate transport protein n=1 Tax=Bacillus thermotolerans TaxID=1221996 RepID=A0A0F5I592_BACTR|nr:chromate transporter [Bacillus thermotolerans]KKB36625.1 Chromate transport protein [Bacillus thermotolerans]KKB40623.1 Chromate transport protein [Bacillus thermotolerans]KKB41284.1 Chromate transport protein [Bacillus thermotolerans]